jgi:TetR/AcrR family transcriptional regulator, transcriptional repressor for nem operon
VKERFMGRPKSFDEDSVLRAAQDLFWDAGFSAASMADLMSVTGLGKGSLYAAFGDKRQLFLRVYGDYCDGLVASARAALDRPAAESADAVIGFLRRAATNAVGDRGQRGCMLARAAAELAGRDDEVVDRARRTLLVVEDYLTAAISRGQQEGTLMVTAPARDLARLVLAITRGFEALGKAGASAETLSAAADTAIAVLQPLSTSTV